APARTVRKKWLARRGGNSVYRVLLIGVVGAFALQPATAAPKAGKPEIFRHLFVLPGDDRLAGERGRLRVPETNKPGARQIELAFGRVPGHAKKTSEPPIFWIEGGPGESAIAAFNDQPAMIPMLREFGDVIAVDQRGAGESSEVLDCPQ